MEQHFQDLAPKVKHDKNLDTVAAHISQHFDQNLPHKSVVKQ